MASRLTAEERTKRLKRRSRRHFTATVILLSSVILVGGTLLAVMLYLYGSGQLTPVFDLFNALFIANEIDRYIVFFWCLAVPLVLVVILIINSVRRRKLKYYRRTWEETVRIAVEADRQAYHAEEERKRRTHRFSVLNDIPTQKRALPAREGLTLADICVKFRAFAANKLHLYYTESQIREFVASLAVSHIIILQGLSGTGKTSLTYAFGEFISNPSTIVPVQPMWKERSDLLGYYNEFTRKYNETVLLRKMYEANGSNEIFITVLDEMNIARVEYYFAEFLSLLEIPNPELRYLEVVSDIWEDDPAGLKNGSIKLPENMWFIGTANNDDSTFAISDKVYDRAMLVDLDSRTPAFETEEAAETVKLSFPEFQELVEGAERGYEITKRNERRLKELDEYLVEHFQITFGNRIMRQIRNYISVFVSCGGEELEALDDILAKKVFRKLTYKDLSLMHGELEKASEYLVSLFGEGKMERCRNFLARVTRM